MVTGDSAETARAGAGKLGIADVEAEVLPAEKAAVVARLRAEGRSVAMAGDGINDAPALAGRLTSFSLGEGAPLAKGVAQVTLLDADLRLVPWTIALARSAVRRVQWLLAGSTLYNLAFVALAAAAAGNTRKTRTGSAMFLTLCSPAYLYPKASLFLICS